ncbi:MAG: hypothetical protein M1331_01105 [Candidatus Marsarchaeota archaeon]|nr:hypothetical protein [Candidatus Marsarchaeota archaeon]
MLNETEIQEIEKTIEGICSNQNPIALDCLSIYSHSGFKPQFTLRTGNYFATCVERTINAKCPFDKNEVNSIIQKLVELENHLSPLKPAERFNNFTEIIRNLVNSQKYYKNQIENILKDMNNDSKNLITFLAAFLKSSANKDSGNKEYLTVENTDINYILPEFQKKANLILKESFGTQERNGLAFYQIGDEFVKRNFGVWVVQFSNRGHPYLKLFLYPLLIKKLMDTDSELIQVLGLEEKCRSYTSLIESPEKPNYFGDETEMPKEETIVAKIMKNLKIFGIPELQIVGKEYLLDVGRIDLLAKDSSHYYVIEVKKERAKRK